jgi:beta-glucosidase
VTAGVDLDMVDRLYATLVDSVREGLVEERVINQAARRVLIAKERAGLFDRPFSDEKALPPLSRAEARRAAQRSIVLLKNDGVLPLESDQRIAVIGSLASSRDDLLGTWSGQGKADDVVSVMDALRARKANIADIASADVVVAIVGETRDLSGEAASRASLTLPGEELLDLAAGKPLVVIVISGRPLVLTRAAERSHAMLQAWNPGIEGGHAITDILFGDVNPSAKLPVTFPRSIGQVPIHYAHLPTGRPADPKNKFTSKYIDVPHGPLFPFGFGLSYTKFEYSDLKVTPASASAVIRNTGSRAGEEIVQLYIRDRVASVSRPVRELRNFRRVALGPGESKRVEFNLTPRDLQFWDGCAWIVEPGTFDVWIAPDAASGLQGSFEWKEPARAN